MRCLVVVVGNEQVGGLFLVPVHKTHCILFVKGADIDAILVVELEDKVCVFDDKHPFGFALVQEVVGQSPFEISQA